MVTAWIRWGRMGLCTLRTTIPTPKRAVTRVRRGKAATIGVDGCRAQRRQTRGGGSGCRTTSPPPTRTSRTVVAVLRGSRRPAIPCATNPAPGPAIAAGAKGPGESAPRGRMSSRRLSCLAVRASAAAVVGTTVRPRPRRLPRITATTSDEVMTPGTGPRRPSRIRSRAIPTTPRPTDIRVVRIRRAGTRPVPALRTAARTATLQRSPTRGDPQRARHRRQGHIFCRRPGGATCRLTANRWPGREPAPPRHQRPAPHPPRGPQGPQPPAGTPAPRPPRGPETRQFMRDRPPRSTHPPRRPLRAPDPARAS